VVHVENLLLQESVTMNTGRLDVWRGLSALALLGGFGSAVAAEPNFNYNAVTVSYVGVSLDENLAVPIGTPSDGFAVHDSLSGVALSASVQAADNLFIGVGVKQVSSSGLGTEIEQNDLALGLGYVIPAGLATDVVVSGELLRVKAEACNRFACVNESTIGYGFTAGARHWLARSVEVNGSLSTARLGEFDSTTSLGLGATYWLNGHSSAKLQLGFGTDSTVATIGYRFAF